MLHFLLISSDQRTTDTVADIVQKYGFYLDIADTFENGLKRIETQKYDALVIELSGSDDNCIPPLKKIIDLKIVAHIVGIATDDCLEKALKAVDVNKCVCLSTPLDSNEFRLTVDNIAKVAELTRDVREKEKRLLHLEVINEIARKTLSYKDGEKLLWDLARLIHEKLNLYNVNIFLVDEKRSKIELSAFAGGFGDDLVVGYSLLIGQGISGWVAENCQSLVTGDVRTEPRRIKGFEFEDDVLSEMAVPVLYNDAVLGVLHFESTELNAFTPDDVMVLETVADQMALAFENLRLSRELLESKKLSETINDSLPASILILNDTMNIEYANLTFCAINYCSRDKVIGRPINDVFSDEFKTLFDLSGALKQVIEDHRTINYSNIRHTSPLHPDRILNITFSYLEAGKQGRIMVLLQDVTEYTNKTYQLSLLREISLAMQGVLDRDKLLHMVLTCVTAGFAIGFSRAFLFLVDNESKQLRGIMGVGPISQDEANRIWNELSKQDFTFSDYLEKIEGEDLPASPLNDVIKTLSFDLRSVTNVLTEAVRTSQHHHVTDAWNNSLVNEAMKTILASDEFVTIPLIKQNEVIGVLMADNAFSGRGVTEESIEVLSLFAGSAANAIETARMLTMLEKKVEELEYAYLELKKTQDLLIRNEKLAVIGEVSTRLAHEIRNPLATIGGFAQSIPKRYDDRERTIRNANFIVEEVKRLEYILSTVLDFSRPSVPRKAMTDINKLIVNTINIFESEIKANHAAVTTCFKDESLNAEFDALQIEQVLINIIHNALNAMPDGGIIDIKTLRDGDRIRIDIIDSGKGIAKKNLESIFEPFFTTHENGTGLGLSISHMIMQNHQGTITVNSKEGEGTAVSVFLPINSSQGV